MSRTAGRRRYSPCPSLLHRRRRAIAWRLAPIKKNCLALTRVAVALEVPVLDAVAVGVGSDGTSQHAVAYVEVHV
jgi:hypothetical protein